MAKKKKQYDDLGLGAKGTSGSHRALNKDGSFNVRKLNVPFFGRLNFFHSLVSMSWPRFIALLLLGYFVVNLLFASIYVLVGVENLTGIDGETPFEHFIGAYFFSSQTITTLGYGRTAPVGMAANIVAAVESMLGLLGFALATGLLYGRFSKPQAKLKYSKHAVVCPYREINGFMFRMINPKRNQLLEVNVTISLSLKRTNSDLRDFHLLELERSHVVFLPSVWTVVHPIDESSPLYQLKQEDVIAKDAEVIITVRAFDETSSQKVYSRTSYKANEILWGRKFVYIIERDDRGISVDVSRISETEKKELNG